MTKTDKTVYDILRLANQRGISLTAKQGILWIGGKVSPSPELSYLIKRHRPAIIDALSSVDFF